MAVRRKAQTQTEAYWQRDFRVRPEDIEAIYDRMLEDGRPRTTGELVYEVIERYCRKEALARKPEDVVPYMPKEHYTVGQQLFFPNLGYAIGTVTAVRPGQNPRYGDFSVITVALAENQIREFAADLALPHPLNDFVEEVVSEEEEQLSVEELCQRHGNVVQPLLEEALAQNPEFVRFDDMWFLRGLLPEVHLGHRNLAEAVIDVAGRPLLPEEILQQVDLDGEAKPGARIFALNLALQADERFDNVGLPTQPRWFLYNLEPPAVITKPSRLIADYPTTGGELVHRESLEIAQEIGDELDALSSDEQAVAEALETGKTSFVLNYPHRREGTLPLTPAIRALFPIEGYTRAPIQFVDARTGTRWAGWLLPQEGYGWGLGDWYREQELPAGTTVELLASSEPNTVVVQCDMRSRRSEWVKVPRVENNRLTFEISKRAYVCRYDRNLLLGAPNDTRRLDELRERYEAENLSLFQVLQLVFPELAKLGSQGLVHAKALYSAINVLWRCGAIPILAQLARHACFDPVGGGNWAFDESLVDVVYMTAEEMEQRPHTRRADLIRDRVLPYGSLA